MELWGGAQSHPITWGDVGGGAKSGTAVTVPGWGTGDTGWRLRGRELGLPGNMCIQDTGHRKRRGRRDRLTRGPETGDSRRLCSRNRKGGSGRQYVCPGAWALGPAVPPGGPGPTLAGTPHPPERARVSHTHTIPALSGPGSGMTGGSISQTRKPEALTRELLKPVLSLTGSRRTETRSVHCERCSQR